MPPQSRELEEINVPTELHRAISSEKFLAKEVCNRF